MDNPARTSAHLARIDSRRRDLEIWCADAFAARNRFVLEIGCGHGHFLTAYAQAHPDELCVGIDIELERIERALRKQRRAGFSNLHFLRAEAGLFLEALPGPARASAIYVLFPDPWPKRRHHKNRLLSPSFLERLADRACPGARLYFRTDYASYFADARRVAGASAYWAVSEEAWPFEAPTIFQERAHEYHSFATIRLPDSQSANRE